MEEVRVIGVLDVTITAPADVQAEKTDAWDLEQMWSEFRAELAEAGAESRAGPCTRHKMDEF